MSELLKKLRERTVRVQDMGASWDEPDNLSRAAAKLIDSLTRELLAIEKFGYENSGHGFSCARMASRALGRPVRNVKGGLSTS